MDALRRASAILFFTLGSIMLTLLIFRQAALIAILDLPMIFFSLVYGGLALLTGGGKKPSTIAISIVGLFLLVLFVLFLWLNFSFPHQVTVPV
ncbi:MAG: hypothetical protein ABL890_04905 [Candidatus Peribacteraceae bacterium]